MKITIAHTQEEAREAAIIRRFAESLLGGAKVNESDHHPPFRHIYIATKLPPKSHENRRNTCGIPLNVV